MTSITEKILNKIFTRTVGSPIIIRSNGGYLEGPKGQEIYLTEEQHKMLRHIKITQEQYELICKNPALIESIYKQQINEVTV